MSGARNFFPPEEVNLPIMLPKHMEGYRRLRQGERAHELFYRHELTADGQKKTFMTDDNRIGVLIQLWWFQNNRVVVQRNYPITQHRLNEEFAKGSPDGK